MNAKSDIISSKSSPELDTDKNNNLKHSNNASLLSRLYDQIIGIKIKPGNIQLDENESYKELHRDYLIKIFIYLSDLFTNYCLPYRLSSIILPIPGLLLHISFFLIVYLSSEVYPYHYILWIITEYFVYFLDVVDGKQARRNGTQSLARHYWDHWCDTFNMVISSLIIIKLYPFNMKYRIPSFILLFGEPFTFYMSFCEYYCTGILLEPYTIHLWKYIYVLFLSLSVIIYDINILNNINYQIILSILSILLTIGRIRYFIYNIYFIKRSSIYSIKLFVILFLSPLISTIIFIVINDYKYLNEDSLYILFYRILFSFVICSYTLNLHYNQLINQSPSLFTTESIIFIFSLFTLFIQNYFLNLIFIVALTIITLSINIIKLIKRLRRFIDMYPQIGFPLFITNQKLHCHDIIKNK